MKQRTALLFATATVFFTPIAFGQEMIDASITQTVTDAMKSAASATLMPTAITWLSAFMGLQFILTNISLLKSGGEIDSLLAKLVGSIVWFSFCVYAINNGPDFIDSVGTGLLSKFAPDIPGPGTIIATILGICAALMTVITIAGTTVVGSGSPAIANVLICVLIVVFAVGMLMAVKVAMLQLEVGFVVLLSPLSFSLLGMNALRDQGIAPLKSLISLAYRIILFGIIFASFSKVSDIAAANLQSLSWTDPTTWGASVKSIFSSFAAYPFIAFLAFKSDAIAATLAGGSSNLGSGDVASAAAAGAAAGAAIATGGAALTGATSGASNSMSDFVKSLRENGSVSNAGYSGNGGSESGLMSPPSPSMSMGSGGAPTPGGGGGGGTGGPGTGGGSAPGGAPAFDGTARGFTPEQRAKIAPPRAYPSAEIGKGPTLPSQQTAKGAGPGETRSSAATPTGTGQAQGAAPSLPAGRPGQSSGPALGTSSRAPGASSRGETTGSGAQETGGFPTSSGSGSNYGSAGAESGPMSPQPPSTSVDSSNSPVSGGGGTGSGAGDAPGGAPAFDGTARGFTPEQRAAIAPQERPYARAEGSGANSGSAPQVPTSASAAEARPTATTGAPKPAQTGGSAQAQEMPSSEPPPTTSSDSGSGATAGIAGPGSRLEETLDKISGHLEKFPGQQKPTLTDRLGEANRHVAQEQATTTVHINTHSSD